MEAGHETEMRRGWRDDISWMLTNDPGVVVTVHVLSTTEVYRSRKRWSAGKAVMMVSRTGETEDFFADYAGGDCTAYSGSPPRRYSLEWRASQVSPADILPSFLGLQVLHLN